MKPLIARSGVLLAAVAAIAAPTWLMVEPGSARAQPQAPSTWQMAASPETRGSEANSVLWLMQHTGNASMLYVCKSVGGGFPNDPPAAKCSKVQLPG